VSGDQGAQHERGAETLVDKYGASLKTFSRLVKMLEDECVDLKESISVTIKEMRKKKAKMTDAGVGAGEDSTPSKTPLSTPAQSRSVSPTKSALRNASLTPALTSSAKRKVAFSLADLSLSTSASEDDLAPETPSKRPRTRTTPRRAAAAAARVLPVRKADKDKEKVESASSEEAEMEDVEMLMSNADTPTRAQQTRTPRTPRRLVASEPVAVAGPSTPRRPPATPTHAYRTPPSARIRPLSLLSGDGDDDGDDVDVDLDEAEEAVKEGDNAEAEAGSEDGALPPSRRFRPVFLDRAQWAQRAPRLARDRAAAERQVKELVERWGHPFGLLGLVTAGEAAG